MRLRTKTLVKEVATAGTAVQVSTTPIFTPLVIFQGANGNTNGVFIGDVDVDNTYHELNPGETLTLTARESSAAGEFDLSQFYVDADTNGNDVIVTYVAQV